MSVILVYKNLLRNRYSFNLIWIHVLFLKLLEIVAAFNRTYKHLLYCTVFDFKIRSLRFKCTTRQSRLDTWSTLGRLSDWPSWRSELQLLSFSSISTAYSLKSQIKRIFHHIIFKLIVTKTCIRLIESFRVSFYPILQRSNARLRASQYCRQW